MKYIIVQTATGDDYAILFDEILTHKVVAGGRPVVSAGFCQLRSLEPTDERQYDSNGCVIPVLPVAYGQSTSLGLKSREGDAAIIAAAIRRRI